MGGGPSTGSGSSRGGSALTGVRKQAGLRFLERAPHFSKASLTLLSQCRPPPDKAVWQQSFHFHQLTSFRWSSKWLALQPRKLPLICREFGRASSHYLIRLTRLIYLIRYLTSRIPNLQKRVFFPLLGLRKYYLGKKCRRMTPKQCQSSLRK